MSWTICLRDRNGSDKQRTAIGKGAGHWDVVFVSWSEQSIGFPEKHRFKPASRHSSSLGWSVTTNTW